MITLALDTSTPFLTLALQWPGGQLDRAERIERAHAERLPAGVRALFDEAGLDFHAQRIVIGTGPGSYTGVRIGASYALALAQVWQADLVGVSTLTALLAEQAGLQAPALDARKDNVYGGLYQVSSEITEVAAPAKMAQSEFIAEAAAQGAQLRQEVTPSGLSLIRAAATLAQPEPQLHLSYL